MATPLHDDAHRGTVDAGRISAMAFFVGYACAALAPLPISKLRRTEG